MKKDYSFYNTVSLKKPHSFYRSHLLKLKIICLQNTAKNILSSKHVSVWYHKKHLHCTISWHARTTFLKHFKSKCLYISVYFSKKFLFQRFYLVVWVVGGGWTISLRRLAVWVSQNVLQFFILKFFSNSTIFQYFDTFVFCDDIMSRRSKIWKSII